VYRRRLGSGPAEQQKKVDLDWKPGSTTASGMRGFLQPADTGSNVGAKSGGIEEEEGMNNSKEPLGVYIVGRGGRWPTALGVNPRPTAPPLVAPPLVAAGP
jgi:hypothetical protein